jgi:hypothetical protein
MEGIMKVVAPSIAPVAIVEVDRSITGSMVEEDMLSVSRFTLFVNNKAVFKMDASTELYPFWCVTCHHPQEHCYCPCKTCGVSIMQCDCPAIEACRSGCGRQLVLEYASHPGYGAGNVYTAELACGHTNTDDCSYLED